MNSWRSVSLLLLMTSALLLSAAEELTDEKLREKLVGEWIVDVQTPNYKIRGTATLKSDGTVISQAVFTRLPSEQKFAMSYEGTWEVKDGYIIETVSKSSHTQFIAVGLVTKDKIHSIDDQAFEYLTEQGKIVKRQRKK
jgi:hypothetical protein